MRISCIIAVAAYALYAAGSYYAILNIFYLLYPPTSAAFSLKRHELMIVCMLFSLFCLTPFILSRYRTAILKLNLFVMGTSVLLLILIGSTDMAAVLSRPLLVSDRLSKADVIIILGGNPISPKLSYAAALFKDGYASQILFLGGRNEDRIKFAAWENGIDLAKMFFVPGTDTYQEASTAKQIFHKKGWKEGILISGPTHMARASKTFARQGIRILCAPVPEYIWYPRLYVEALLGGLTGLKLDPRLGWENTIARHIRFRELLHEYMGILYYYLRGRV